jgi:hypothetical protein
MKLESYLKKVNMKEIIICLSLIVIGYMTAQLFMRKYNRFSVGGQNSCPLGSDLTCKLGTFAQRPGGGAPSPDPCSKVKADDCNKSWWQSKSDGAGNKPIGIGCKYIKNKCITPGTGFKTINGCPTKSCDVSPPPPPSNSKTSYNCSGSMCVSVSGTSGTYSNESECLNSDCEKTTPSASGQCILGGYLSFSNDGCKYKRKTYTDYTTAPSGACDCKNWYSPTKIIFTLIMIGIVLFFVIFPIILMSSGK